MHEALSIPLLWGLSLSDLTVWFDRILFFGPLSLIIRPIVYGVCYVVLTQSLAWLPVILIIHFYFSKPWDRLGFLTILIMTLVIRLYSEIVIFEMIIDVIYNEILTDRNTCIEECFKTLNFLCLHC